jgi:hypothetical protein
MIVVFFHCNRSQPPSAAHSTRNVKLLDVALQLCLFLFSQHGQPQTRCQFITALLTCIEVETVRALQVKAVQTLGPNYLGVFNPREAAISDAGAAVQAAVAGRNSLQTSLAAAFSPLAHDSRSLVDFSCPSQSAGALHCCSPENVDLF